MLMNLSAVTFFAKNIEKSFKVCNVGLQLLTVLQTYLKEYGQPISEEESPFKELMIVKMLRTA